MVWEERIGWVCWKCGVFGLIKDYTKLVHTIIQMHIHTYTIIG